MKHAIIALGLKRYKTATKYLLKDQTVAGAIVEQVQQQIRRECNEYMKCDNRSKYRVKTFEDLKHVSLHNLAEEVKEKTPITYKVFRAISERKLNVEENKTALRSAVSFGILIHARNKNMNAIQKLLSVLLYKGKARVKVNST